MTHDLLAGVRVLEASFLLSGAITGMVMADLGADVIKLEPPWGDPLRSRFGGSAVEASPAFRQVHRNKRGISVDLADTSARSQLASLVETCDVIIDATVRPLLQLPDIKLAARDKVRCRISAFGFDSPFSGIPGTACSWRLWQAQWAGRAARDQHTEPGFLAMQVTPRWRR